MTLGEKLQQLRRSRGLSQEQLAEALGVSRQAISKWECGDSEPDLEKLRAICAYFGVTTDYMIWPNAEDAPRQSAEKTGDHAARRESVRSFVRKNVHWAGYIIAIVGGVLLARFLLSLLSMYLLMGYASGFVGGAELPTGVLGTTVKMMLPYLFLYLVMLVGGLLLGRWLKRRNAARGGEEDTHDEA